MIYLYDIFYTHKKSIENILIISSKKISYTIIMINYDF